MVELQPGDFLYQSDQELFLVVIEETENSYKFAAHGWREIGKERLEQYLDHEQAIIYRAEDVEKAIEEEGDSEAMEKFEDLRELFEIYEDANIDEDGPHSDFSMEDK